MTTEDNTFAARQPTTYQSPRAMIQYQGRTGCWTALASVDHNDGEILHGMRSAARSFPGRRIRCVDSAGSVLDIL